MLVAQVQDGLVFWPEHEVASLVPEFRNWWRVVHCSGLVAHRPTPPPPGPWVPLGDGLVYPKWLRPAPQGWADPAHFLFPPGDMPEVVAPAPYPLSENLPCLPEQIYALIHGKKSRQFVWLTDRGEFITSGANFLEVSSRHPDMLGILRSRLYIHLGRLRKIRSLGSRRIFIMDNGKEFPVSANSPETLEALGLPSLQQLHPTLPIRFGEYQLRDWPFEIRLASAKVLQQCFPALRSLLANLIWQRFRYRQAGLQRVWARSYGGFWYEAVVHTLFRAGFLTEGEVAQRLPPGRPVLTRRSGRQERIYSMIYDIFDQFVDVYQLFTFQDFGFVDPNPEYTLMGSLHPQIVLISEKDDFFQYARWLAEEFGVTHYHQQGQPSQLRSECLAARLAHLGPLQGVAITDYDVGGWMVGHSVANQLTKYGAPMPNLHFLIRQEHFTERELSLYSRPCPSSTPSLRTKARLWVEESGGLNGEARGIYSNHIQPYERLRTIFSKWFDDMAVL